MTTNTGSRNFFENFAGKITKLTGKPGAFIASFVIIVVWAITGPIFGFSDTWQLVINTGTTIVTFLMVFVIQHSQNKDTIALHLKLNELIAANKNASNRLIDIEDLSEQELETIKLFYIKLSDLAKKEKELSKTHNLEEATDNHLSKKHKQP